MAAKPKPRKPQKNQMNGLQSRGIKRQEHCGNTRRLRNRLKSFRSRRCDDGFDGRQSAFQTHSAVHSNCFSQLQLSLLNIHQIQSHVEQKQTVGTSRRHLRIRVYFSGNIVKTAFNDMTSHFGQHVKVGKTRISKSSPYFSSPSILNSKLTFPNARSQRRDSGYACNLYTTNVRLGKIHFRCSRIFVFVVMTRDKLRIRRVDREISSFALDFPLNEYNRKRKIAYPRRRNPCVDFYSNRCNN